MHPNISTVILQLQAPTHYYIDHHNGYCVCLVIGRSGNGTHGFFAFLFASLSFINLILVASSFNTSEMPKIKR